MIGKPIALIQVPIIGAKVFPSERSERVFASELCGVQIVGCIINQGCRNTHNEQENTMNKKVIGPTPVSLAQQELEEFGELVWGPELLKAVRDLPVDADPATYKIADLENEEVVNLMAEFILGGNDWRIEAYSEVFAKAQHAGLSHLGSCLASEAAVQAAEGGCWSEAEVEEHFLQRGGRTSSEIAAAIAEIKQADLWPWRVN